MKIDARTLAGTAILAALVVVFDYTMKYSGLKIPFPWLPTLKFDFTGIPIVLSLYLFGFVSGVFTSAIAFVGILARSGDVVSSSMKALAEVSTIVGMKLAMRVASNFRRSAALAAGVSARSVIMAFANLLVLPAHNQIPFLLVIGISPLIVAFNVIQGSISILGGYFIYEAIKLRLPSLIHRNAKERIFGGLKSESV